VPATTLRYAFFVLDKSIAAVEKDDIDALVVSGRMEDRRIEYKRELPGNSDADKREFLADVSSFANALGGDLLYGVTEDKGAPKEALGVVCTDADGAKLRLQSILESNVDPRLPSYTIAAVTGFRDGPVVIIRVEPSWRAPHMVTFGGLRRFYIRRDGQKVEMEVTDLRAAFVGSETLANRIRAFREERITGIIGGRSALRTASLPTLVLQIVPIGAAFLATDFDPRRAFAAWQRLNREGKGFEFVYSAKARPNLDGLLVYSSYYEERLSASPTFTQIFRNGGVEFTAGFVDYRDSETLRPAPYVTGAGIEATVLDMCRNYGEFRGETGLGGSAIIMLSLIRMRSVPLLASDRSGLRALATQHQFDRDVLVLPEIIVDSFSDMPSKLRPLFDTVWQAAGVMHSAYYDESGNYTPPNQ
jgi:hypothetical protein